MAFPGRTISLVTFDSATVAPNSIAHTRDADGKVKMAFPERIISLVTFDRATTTAQPSISLTSMAWAMAMEINRHTNLHWKEILVMKTGMLKLIDLF
jgi:hypothetical protein